MSERSTSELRPAPRVSKANLTQQHRRTCERLCDGQSEVVVESDGDEVEQTEHQQLGAVGDLVERIQAVLIAVVHL